MRAALERFPLGPSLRKCCGGGVLHLAFGRIDDSAAEVFNYLQLRLRKAQDSWRLVVLDSAVTTSLYGSEGQHLHEPGRLPTFLTRKNGVRVLRDAAGQRWLLEGCQAPRPQLFLFGAGHVGAAIVKGLADLPCHVTWIDEREEMFPLLQPAKVTIEAADVPEALVFSVPSSASFLVLTCITMQSTSTC